MSLRYIGKNHVYDDTKENIGYMAGRILGERLKNMGILGATREGMAALKNNGTISASGGGDLTTGTSYTPDNSKAINVSGGDIPLENTVDNSTTLAAANAAVAANTANETQASQANESDNGRVNQFVEDAPDTGAANMKQFGDYFMNKLKNNNASPLSMTSDEYNANLLRKYGSGSYSLGNSPWSKLLGR